MQGHLKVIARECNIYCEGTQIYFKVMQRLLRGNTKVSQRHFSHRIILRIFCPEIVKLKYAVQNRWYWSHL